jgi:hypothetical protein
MQKKSISMLFDGIARQKGLMVKPRAPVMEPGGMSDTGDRIYSTCAVVSLVLSSSERGLL